MLCHAASETAPMVVDHDCVSGDAVGFRPREDNRRKVRPLSSRDVERAVARPIAGGGYDQIESLEYARRFAQNGFDVTTAARLDGKSRQLLFQKVFKRITFVLTGVVSTEQMTTDIVEG